MVEWIQYVIESPIEPLVQPQVRGRSVVYGSNPYHARDLDAAPAASLATCRASAPQDAHPAEHHRGGSVCRERLHRPLGATQGHGISQRSTKSRLRRRVSPCDRVDPASDATTESGMSTPVLQEVDRTTLRPARTRRRKLGRVRTGTCDRTSRRVALPTAGVRNRPFITTILNRFSQP